MLILQGELVFPIIAWEYRPQVTSQQRSPFTTPRPAPPRPPVPFPTQTVVGSPSSLDSL
jgi:hypothetical protein